MQDDTKELRDLLAVGAMIADMINGGFSWEMSADEMDDQSRAYYEAADSMIRVRDE